MTQARRYDIDWLRVIAFIFLIFYHIGMYYVEGWGWHVKSEHQSTFLQNIMLMINPWRMSLIFLISGIALALVEPKITQFQLLKIRFFRVYIPLAIAMYLIVPPQLFFELIANEGFNGGYLSFMKMYADTGTEMYPQYQHGPLGLLTWNHLWYLAYLWHYTLVYVLLRSLLLRVKWKALFTGKSTSLIFLAPVCLLILYGLFLQPYFPKTYALINDWYSHALYFTIFGFGYALAKSGSMWERVIMKRKIWLCIAASHYVLLLALHHDMFGNWLRASGLDAQLIHSLFITKLVTQWIVCAYIVASLFSVIGYAGAYLNKPSPILKYMNEAILPWYILHQTVIIIIAVALSTLSLGAILEPVLIIVLTFAICALGFELIRRSVITRFIFGMKLKPTIAPPKPVKAPQTLLS